MFRKIKNIPLHPFFLAAYSVLGVFIQNANEIPLIQVFRPLLIALLFIGAVFYSINQKVKNIHRAGLLTTLFLFLVVFYGHIYFSLMLFSVIRELPGRDYIIFFTWFTVILFLASPFVWGRFSSQIMVTVFLNTVSLVALLAPIISIGFVLRQTVLQKKVFLDFQNNARLEVDIKDIQGEELPDIYYIILDGYARADVLESEFGFDNSTFLANLKEEGFYIADQSESNYMQTQLSLSSTLNMQYLGWLSETLQNSSNRGILTEMTINSQVRYSLEDMGYETIAFATSSLFTQMYNADKYLTSSNSSITELEGLLLSSSVIRFFVQAMDIHLPIPDYSLQRQTILYAFDELPQVANLPVPKFVFVHILAPHPPFVFDENGVEIEPDRPYFAGDANGFKGGFGEYQRGYAEELEFINKKAEEAIDGILKNSNRPVVIILQGDHGSGLHTNFMSLADTCIYERYSILNAYYFPEEDRDDIELYPSITPINTFRVIFNHYLSTDLALLADRQYYSTWTKPYDFIDISDEKREPCK